MKGHKRGGEKGGEKKEGNGCAAFKLLHVRAVLTKTLDPKEKKGGEKKGEGGRRRTPMVLASRPRANNGKSGKGKGKEGGGGGINGRPAPVLQKQKNQ